MIVTCFSPNNGCVGGSIRVLLVAVVLQMSLVAVLLQYVVRVAVGEPVCAWDLQRLRRRLPLLPFPSARDWRGEAWIDRRMEGKGNGQRSPPAN